MTTLVGIDALRNLGRIGSVVVLCLVLTSCGLGGDDDDSDPTATTETELESQPTQASEETVEPTETRAPFRLIPSSPESTVEPGAGATAEIATPSTPVLVATSEVESSPEASPAGVEDETPTPESGEPSTASASPELPANAVTGSDGTSGASGVAGLLETGASSPEATPEEPGGTDVDSCDVVEAPPFTGDNADYVVVEEVNFRVGPGADCDSVLDGPLEVGTTLTLLSDPVVRTGDDNEWVQVEIDDEAGWVATEFIEEAE